MRGRIYPNSENFIGSDGKTQSKSLDIGQIGQAVGDVAGSLISSLGSIKDAKLRREYEQRIAQLDKQERAALSKQLAKAQTDADKRKVFADLLAQTSKSRIESGVPKNMQIGLWIGGGIIVLGTMIYILKKINK